MSLGRQVLDTAATALRVARLKAQERRRRARLRRVVRAWARGR